MLSLFEQATFSFRADYIHSPTYQIPQEKTQEQAKAHNLPTSKVHNLPTSKLTTIQQAKLTTFQQAKAHSLQQTKPTTFLQAKSTAILQAKSTAILQAKAHSHTTSLLLKKHSENKQIQQNIPNILPFNIFLKSVLKKNRLSRLFDLEISIFYCNFATNLLTH